MALAAEMYSTFLPLIMNLRGRSKPFQQYQFSTQVRENVSPITWWSATTGTTKEEQQLAIKFLSATSSTAGVERIFSTFGIVHSSIRNKLGTEKAGKLVFVNKLLNKS